MPGSHFRNDASRGDMLAQFVYEHVFLEDRRIPTEELHLIDFSGEGAEEQFRGCDILISKAGVSPYRIDVKSAVDWAGPNAKTGRPLQTFAQEVSYRNKDGALREGWLIDEHKLTDCYVFCWVTEVNEGAKNSSNGFAKVDSLADAEAVEIAVVPSSSLKSLMVRECQREDSSVSDFAGVCRWLLAASDQRRAGAAEPSKMGSFKLSLTKHLPEEPFNVLAGKRELRDISSYFYVAKRLGLESKREWALSCKKQPPKSNAARDISYLRGRGVEQLVHFTPVDNLESILEYGLVPRASLNVRKLAYVATDEYRHEGTRFVNLSITNPNIKMFYGKRKELENRLFAVVSLHPELLADVGGSYSFTSTNAASRQAMACSASELFSGDRPDYFKDCWPTDNQSEVLVESVISPRFIKSIQLPQWAESDAAVAAMRDKLQALCAKRGLSCEVVFCDDPFAYDKAALGELSPVELQDYYQRSWIKDAETAEIAEKLLYKVPVKKTFDSWAVTWDSLSGPKVEGLRRLMEERTWSLSFLKAQEATVLQDNELSAFATIERIINRGRLTVLSEALEQVCSSSDEVTYAHQFQCAAVELLKHQVISGASTISVSKAGVADESLQKVAVAAMDDLQQLAKHVCVLYDCENPFGKVAVCPLCDSPDVVIDWSDAGSEPQSGIVRLNYHAAKGKVEPFTFTRVTAPVRINVVDESLEFLSGYVFRYASFREGQLPAIRRGLRRQDSIVLLPTGSGKSTVFQLVSLLVPGMSFVVCPIVSLIEDQLSNLRSKGIDRAVGITSMLSRSEKEAAVEGVSEGKYLLCYVAPERFQNRAFNEAVSQYASTNLISLIAIDEAHCVSEWGHDFRTAYLGLSSTCRNVCRTGDYVPPIVALTGTASSSVLADIRKDLEILDEYAIIQPSSFDRPEIHFRVVSVPSENKRDALVDIVRNGIPKDLGIPLGKAYVATGKSDTNSGVIFCQNVNGSMGLMATASGTRYGHLGVWDIMEQILPDRCVCYSGRPPKRLGLSEAAWSDQKAKYASQFKNNEKPVMVSTKAFGMGIDKPNVRWVVHYGIPGSLESYYQEVGRAARDKKPAYAYLILSDDFPEINDRLLDYSKVSAEQLLRIDEGEKRRFGGDDVSRVLYFHAKTFVGAREEYLQAEDVLNQCMRRNFRDGAWWLTRKNDDDATERAIYRFCLLGVFESYTIDYDARRGSSFVIIPTSYGGNALRTHIVKHYLDHIRAYNPDAAYLAKAQKDLDEALSGAKDDRDFIMRAMRHLLMNFTYEVLEKSRRQAVATMLGAARQAAKAKTSVGADRALRKQILAYLALDPSSDEGGLRAVVHDAANLEAVLKILRSCKSGDDFFALSGRASRLLEDYPQNYALHLLQAMAKLATGDMQGYSSGISLAREFGLFSYDLSDFQVSGCIGQCLDVLDADVMPLDRLDAALNLISGRFGNHRDLVLASMESPRAKALKKLDKVHEIALLIERGLPWSSKS